MYKDKTYRNVDNRQNKHAHYGDEENNKKKSLVSLQEWVNVLMAAKLWDKM